MFELVGRPAWCSWILVLGSAGPSPIEAILRGDGHGLQCEWLWTRILFILRCVIYVFFFLECVRCLSTTIHAYND